jgi:ElaB/YqjD/DUF883 family membrane-anchored ribosome-binding protein
MATTPKENQNINLTDTAHNLGENIHEAAHDAGRKVRGMIRSAGDDLCHARDYVGSEMRTNPVRSTLIALGVGMVISALLRR